MKESAIQKKIIAYLNFKGCYSIKTITTNRSGSPDIICCYKGLFVALEVKAEKGIVSKLQEYHLEQIKKSGGVAAVVRSVDEVQEVLKIPHEKIKEMKNKKGTPE